MFMRIKRAILYPLLIIFSLSSIKSKAQVFDYVNEISGTRNCNVEDTEIDAFRNVYLVGSFNATADFDPGSVTQFFTSEGNQDVFIQKLDQAGFLIWAHRIGSTGEDVAYSISLDRNNNVLICGTFEGTIDLNPGTGTSMHTSKGGSDVFSIKLSPAGTFIWGRTAGSSSNDIATSISTDTLNNVVIGGSFRDSLDFDPSASTDMHYLQAGGQDSAQAFVWKLSETGNHIWARSFGGSGVHSEDIVNDLVCDHWGNIILVGMIQGQADMDPGINVVAKQGGKGNIFIQKMTSVGNFHWVQTYGDSSHADFASSIDVDGFNNVIVAGAFSGAIDFDPGATTNILRAASNKLDGFIAKFLRNGNYEWARRIGSTGDDQYHDVHLTMNGDIIATGTFEDVADLDPSFFIYEIESSGGKDGFVQLLDSFANFKWVKAVGGDGDDEIKSSTSDINNIIYLTGNFQDTVDFDVYDSTRNLDVFAGSTGVFNCKWIIEEHSSHDSFVVACDSFQYQNISLTETGLYRYVSRNYLNLDSSTLIYLTLNETVISSQGMVGCDSLNYAGQWFYADTVFTDSLISSGGCDSIDEIQISILHSNPDTSFVVTCDIYNWNGTDYSMDGFYTDTLLSSAGCDSVTNLDLTINSIDTEVIPRTDRLEAREKNGAYRWFRCDSVLGLVELIGQQAAILDITEFKYYAVEITKDGCTDTSDCYTKILGLNDHSSIKAVVYPNPSSKNFNVEIEGYAKGEYQVVDISGQVILHNSFEGKTFHLELEESEGIYFLIIKTDQGVAYRKLSLNSD